MRNWFRRQRDDREMLVDALRQKFESEGLVDRLEIAAQSLAKTADDLERHNRAIAEAVPTVGLYETFHVDSGRGVRDAVLYDLEVGSDGRLNGSIMDRVQFDHLMAPEHIAGA